jgi:tetratricopeptide (TPR) repeat protein
MPSGLDDHADALEWLDTEHQALLAVMRHAVANGRDATTSALVWALEPYFERRGLWSDRAAAHRLAAEAAGRLGDTDARAHSHRNLARSLVQMGRVEEARAQFDIAMGLFVERDDARGRADVHRGVGWLLSSLGDYRAGIDHARRALDLYREAGDRLRQAQALNAIGWRHAQLGEYGPALDHCRRGLDLFIDVAAEFGHGDFQGEAETWDSLGYIHHRRGDHDAALSCFDSAIHLLSANGERYFLSEVLTRAGEVHRDLGAFDPAARDWRRALAILDSLGHANAAGVRAKLSELDQM